MAFEAITSAVKSALGVSGFGDKDIFGRTDDLGQVSGKSARDPGWLTSTGKDVAEEGHAEGDIYWPQTDNFYFKKGQWYLKPREDLLPKSSYTTSAGGFVAPPEGALEGAIVKGLQGETTEVRKVIEAEIA